MDYHGFDDADDEAFRLLGPEWNRLSKMMYIGVDKETGNAEYIDLSYTFPEEVITKPIRALLGGDPTSKDYLDNVNWSIALGILIIARRMISAAVPWIGALIAARFANPAVGPLALISGV